MIKRVVKKKESKQGAILVLVVLILALAMIFITAAMMLTQATRGRLYEEAMQSQARLTVTSASEVFLEALQTQEITDAQISSLLTVKPSDTGDKIRMVVDGVPGMASETNDPENKNCTFLNIYYPDTSDKTIVWADFTTTIGDEVENVRIVFKVEPEGDPTNSDRFTNQVEVLGNSGAATLRFTGGIGMVNNSAVHPTDNTILFRGGATDNTSDAKYYSDMVFAAGSHAYFGGGNEYYGNMVFLEGAYMNSDASVRVMSGDFYFIGTTNDAGFKHTGNDNIWSSISSTNFIFAGRTVQNDSGDQNHKIKDLVTGTGRNCYFVSNGGTVINTTGYYNGNSYTVSNAGTLSDDKSQTLENYKTYQASLQPFPSSLSSVLCQMNPDGQWLTATGDNYKLTYETYSKSGQWFAANSVIPSGTEVAKNPLTPTYPDWAKDSNNNIPDSKKISINPSDPDIGLNAWDTKNGGAADRIIPLDPGVYYITGGTTMSNCNNKKPWVICIDGSRGNQYRFYFAAGSTTTMNCLVFAMYSVDNQNPSSTVFILEPGANIVGPEAQYRCHDNSLCSQGFISISRNCSSAAAIGAYVQGTPQANETNSTTHYSNYYDNVRKPAMYIFGEGSGTYFQCGDDCVIEAYIGLYGSAYFTFRNDLAGGNWFYGRLEVSSLPTYNTTGNFYMPYCPKPSSTSSLPNNRPAVTMYKVQNIIYYY